VIKKRTASIVMVIFLWVNVFGGMVSQARSNSFDSLTAKAVMLMDGENGTVIFEKNSKKKLPLASITKVIAMIIVIDEIRDNNLSMDDIVVTSKHAANIGGSHVYLRQGEKFTVKEMLKAVAIRSANDCMVALAEKISGSECAFVARMNQKAKSLGMKDTNFLDCTGLTDEGHYSTAQDIALMASVVVKEYPIILEFSSIVEDTFRNGKFPLHNTNKLINKYKGVDGLKTGFTNKAGYCLAATAKRNNVRLISVVLGTKDNSTRFDETRRLLDYGFNNLENHNFGKKGELVKKVGIKNGVKKQIEGVYKDNVNLTFLKKDKDKIKKNVKIFNNIEAPVKKGKVLGKVEYRICGNIMANKDIVAKEDVLKASSVRLFFRAILNWLGIE